MSALEYGGASAATILPLVLRFGKNVSPEDYPTVILAPLVKLFASPDRGTRMALLDHLPEYADKLDKKTVDSKVFPHLVSPCVLEASRDTEYTSSKPDFQILSLSFGKRQSSRSFLYHLWYLSALYY